MPKFGAYQYSSKLSNNCQNISCLPEGVNIGLVLSPGQIHVHSSGKSQSLGCITLGNLTHNHMGEVESEIMSNYFENVEKDFWGLKS